MPAVIESRETIQLNRTRVEPTSARLEIAHLQLAAVRERRMESQRVRDRRLTPLAQSTDDNMSASFGRVCTGREPRHNRMPQDRGNGRLPLTRCAQNYYMFYKS
jgi:hypothetical protein